MYDQYGKDDIYNNGHSERHHRSRRCNGDDDHFSSFAFRDPEDVFREFFGGSLFADIFCKYFYT